jgi:LAO/AO transport system kinase
VINKADGDNKPRAERARVEYSSALHLFPASPDGWIPRVLTCSSLHGQGIGEVWEMVRQHRAQQEAGGHFDRRRRKQALSWMHELISLGLGDLFRDDPSVQARTPELEQAVKAGTVSSLTAARELLTTFRKGH